MASLKDIAHELGVSVSLVSKVLNDRLGTTGARPAMVKAIRQKARKLGYRKNISALALRKGRHDVIGVFIHDAGSAANGSIEALLRGVSSATTASEIRQFLNFFKGPREFGALSGSAHTGMMDGLIVGGVVDRKLKSQLLVIRKTGIPVVTVYDEPISLDLPNVGMDQSELYRVATQHLIEQGCRRITHIKSRETCFKGYKTALADNGIRYYARRVFSAVQDQAGYSTGEAAVRKFIREGTTFDGVVTHSVEESMGAAAALADASLEIPGDVRIIGIGDTPHCECGRVPLSAVSRQLAKRGELAVELLLRAIGGQEVSSINVSPLVKIRASSA